MSVANAFADNVAKIGATEYETLQAAINAAPANTETTITLIGQNAAVSGNGFQIPDGTTGKNIIIDFNGCTYTVTGGAVGSTGTINQCMHFYKDNTLTLKNGTIKVQENLTGVKIMMQNYCDLTLDHFNVDCSNVITQTYSDPKYGEWYGKTRPKFNFNSGSSTITNSTITFPSDDLFGVLIDENGTTANLTIGEGTVINGNVTALAGNATINAGTITGNVSTDKVEANQAEGSIIINGGTIAGNTTATYGTITTSVGTPAQLKAAIEGLEDDNHIIKLTATIKLEANIAASHSFTLDRGSFSITKDKFSIIMSDNVIVRSSSAGAYYTTSHNGWEICRQKVTTGYNYLPAAPVAKQSSSYYYASLEDAIDDYNYAIYLQSNATMTRNVTRSATNKSLSLTINLGDYTISNGSYKIYLHKDVAAKLDKQINSSIFALCDGESGGLYTYEGTGTNKYCYVFRNENEAKIGETEYATFALATASAGENDVITLLRNVLEPYTMTTSSQILKVKKDGYTITVVGYEGFVAKSSLTGDITTYTQEEAAFKITKADNTVSYSTDLSLLQATGTTVTLLKDFTTTSSPNCGSTMYTNKSIILDLGGKTLYVNTSTSSYNSCIRILEGCGLTIKNGTIEMTPTTSNKSNGIYVDNACSLIIEPTATINAHGVSAVTVWGTATLETAGTLYAENDFVIAGNGSAGNGGYNVTIAGGSVTSDGQPAIYHPNTGTVTISGGEITGATAIYQKCGTLNITGGTITGNGTKTDFVHNGNGANATGDAVVIENCGYPGGTPAPSITGGTFISTNAKAVASYAYGERQPVTGFISAGTFSSNVDASYLAEGIVLTQDGNNYVATQSVAKIGNVSYATLEAAIDAATAGQTVTLQADIDANAQIGISKKLTLDLNGKKINGTNNNRIFVLTTGADMTVVDNAQTKGGITATGNDAFALSGTNNSDAANIILTIGEGVNVSSTTDCCVFIRGAATLYTAGNLTSSGTYATIQGNGMDLENVSVINITGGTITQTQDMAIYHPQNGTLNITGGNINAHSAAVELRSGKMDISGGTFTITCPTYECNPNGDGSTTKGAAIAIAQHTTSKPIVANITGGTFNIPTSGTAKKLSVTNPQNNAFNNVTVTGLSTLFGESVIVPEGFMWVDNGDNTCSLGHPAVMIGNTGYATLQAAFDAAASQQNATITLQSDIALQAPIAINDGKAYTVNMNGHSVSYGTSSNGKGVFILSHGSLEFTGEGTVYDTTNDGYGAVMIYGSSDPAATNYSVLTVGNNVTLASWAGIFVNYPDENNKHAYGVVVNLNGTVKSPGMNTHTKAGNAIYINGSIFDTTGNVPVFNLGSNAVVESTKASGGVGVYAAGYAKWNVAGNISGFDSAIEIRAGELNIAGGNYSATATSFNSNANGNGSTTAGAALVISQHSTDKAINVDIAGGTFSGQHAIYEKDWQNPQNGGAVNIAISGGTFNSTANENKVAVKIEDNDVLASITGGTFNSNVNNYCADGYAAVLVENVYKVGEVSTSELTQHDGATDTEATYTVTTIVTDDNNISHVVETDQAITVTVDDAAGNVGEGVKLTDVKMNDVLALAIASAGTEAKTVTEVKIGIDAEVTESNLAGEVKTITFEVKPEATVTIGESTSTVELSNANLAPNATFTFTLDVTALGVNAGDQVKVVHKSNDYPTETFMTTVKTVGSKQYVTITTTHFSEFEISNEGVSAEDNVVLTDGKSVYNITSNTTVSSVTYERTFPETQVNKFMGWFVPFDYTVTADDAARAKFYKIDMIAHSATQGTTDQVDESKIWIHLKEATAGTTLKGNKPYLIKPLTSGKFTFGGDNKLLAITNESILSASTTSNEYNFYGTYSVFTKADESDADFMYMQGGQIHWCTITGINVPAFRWIIKVNGKAEYARIAFVEDGEETTAIQSAEVAEPNAIEGYYTLNGVKVEKPGKGVYVVKYANGQVGKIRIR